jgi:hypothetical protein
MAAIIIMKLINFDSDDMMDDDNALLRLLRLLDNTLLLLLLLLLLPLRLFCFDGFRLMMVEAFDGERSASVLNSVFLSTPFSISTRIENFKNRQSRRIVVVWMARGKDTNRPVSMYFIE